jgi:hypothetical protein
MTRKLCCWQFKTCGREKGGLMTGILGECPVSSAFKFDGLNNGVGAGRACWMVPDSCCQLDAANQGKSNPCYNCDFYQRVVFEEEDNIKFPYSKNIILPRLQLK